MSDLGAALRAAREAAGVSLAGMARRTHYSKPLLGLLEQGKRTIKPDHVSAYSRALNVPVDTFHATPEDPLRIAHEWLVSDSPVSVHTQSGRRVGESLASALEVRVVELRRLDDLIGGGDLFGLVRTELEIAQDVVNTASYTECTGRRLLTVVGEMAQLAGWVASDAGRHAEARHLYLGGVGAARDAGDSALVGQLLSSLSYQMANVGNPADAALLARSAVKGASDACPLVRALLFERVAWSSAKARNADRTRRALDLVDDLYGLRATGDNEPDWVYWLDRREIDVMAGRCLIELGEPTRAEPLLSSAIAGMQGGRPREIALYLTWLAESYARTGELDAARAALAEARTTAAEVNSARLDLRLRSVECLI